MWIIVWETHQSWHQVPRSKGKNRGKRMKKQAVYRRRSYQKWVPHAEKDSQLQPWVDEDQTYFGEAA